MGRGSFRKNFFDEDNISVGKRYVFFQSLGTPGPGYKKTSPIYFILRGLGESYVSQAAAALGKVSSKQQMNNQQIKKIETYIQVIGQAATNQFNSQHQFLQHMLEYSQKDQSIKMFFQQHRDLLDPDSKNFNYTVFIKLLNEEISQFKNFQQQRQRVLLENARFIEKKIEQLSRQDPEAAEEIERAFYEQDYKVYEKKLDEYDILKKISEDDKFQKDYIGLLRDKIMTIMGQFSRSIGDKQIKEKLQQGVRQYGLSGSEDNLANEVLTLLINYLLNNANFQQLQNETAGAIKKNFLDSLDSKPGHEISLGPNNLKNIQNAVGRKAVKSIEELSISIGKNIGEAFISLSQQARNTIIGQYEVQNELNKILRNVTDMTQITAAQKGQITKLFNQKIAERLQEKNIKLKDLDRQQRQALIKQFEKQQPDFFSPTEIENSLRNSFKVSVQGGSLAEIVQAMIINAIGGALQGGNMTATVHGAKTNVKTDITFNYELPSSLKIKDETLRHHAKRIVDDARVNFVSNYKDRILEYNNGSTSVAEASTAYLDTLRQASKELEQVAMNLGKSGKQVPETVAQAFSSFLGGNISVKQYVKSGNLGFHGGSLGGNGAPDEVLENITEMYTLGGISPIDKDTLYFAVINCGADALGAGLKSSIQDYLLGGAALMMFDDGFTATNNYLETMRTALGFSAAPGLHLFAVNGRLIPASYVYSSIYNALSQAYAHIIEEVQITFKSQASSINKVTITNSISQEGNKPSYLSMPAAQDRWNKVAEDAQNSINISFSFLGGILDIFEGIDKAFDSFA